MRSSSAFSPCATAYASNPSSFWIPQYTALSAPCSYYAANSATRFDASTLTRNVTWYGARVLDIFSSSVLFHLRPRTFPRILSFFISWAGKLTPADPALFTRAFAAYGIWTFTLKNRIEGLFSGVTICQFGVSRFSVPYTV